MTSCIALRRIYNVNFLHKVIKKSMFIISYAHWHKSAWIQLLIDTTMYYSMCIIIYAVGDGKETCVCDHLLSIVCLRKYEHVHLLTVCVYIICSLACQRACTLYLTPEYLDASCSVFVWVRVFVALVGLCVLMCALMYTYVIQFGVCLCIFAL